MNREDAPETYARTAYEIALDDWSGWLKAVHGKLQSEPAAAQTLQDTRALPAEKQRQLEAMLPADSSKHFRQFIGFLADRRQLNFLDEIIGSFTRLMEQGSGMQIAYITSALEMEEADRSKVEAALRRRFGANLAFEYATDPSLLAGMRVRVGDTVIDGSIAGRLDALRTQLAGQ